MEDRKDALIRARNLQKLVQIELYINIFFHLEIIKFRRVILSLSYLLSYGQLMTKVWTFTVQQVAQWIIATRTTHLDF